MDWRLFADLADVVGARRVELEAEPATVGEALETLCEAEPALADRVRSDAGDVEPHISILLNGQDVSGELDTPVQSGDELALLPPVSGG